MVPYKFLCWVELAKPCMPALLTHLLGPSWEGDLCWKADGDPEESQLATFLSLKEVLSWRGYLSSTFPCLLPHSFQILHWGIALGYENLPCEPSKGIHWNIGLGASSLHQCHKRGAVLDQCFPTFFFIIAHTPQAFLDIFFLIVPPPLKFNITGIVRICLGTIVCLCFVHKKRKIFFIPQEPIFTPLGTVPPREECMF